MAVPDCMCKEPNHWIDHGDYQSAFVFKNPSGFLQHPIPSGKRDMVQAG
jgi:hypothetical protein